MKKKKRFDNSRLGSVENDPDDWISELEGLAIEIESIDPDSAIKERDLIVKVLNNLPPEYDVILDGLETQLKKTGDEALTLEEVREKLSTRFERINANKEEEADIEEDKAFAVFKQQLRNGHKTGDGSETNKKEFTGRCWYCNKKGHVALDCTELKKAMIAMKKSDIEKMGEKCNVALDKYPGYNDELGF